MLKRAYGWLPSKPDHRDRVYRSAPLMGQYDYDLRGSMPEVYDQGQTGSCVWQATSAAMEYLRRHELLSDFVPSRLWGYWQTRVVEGTTSSDSGCTVRDAMKVANAIGVPPEVLWPFDPGKVLVAPPDNCLTAAKTDMAVSYAVVNNNLSEILSCFRQRIPVIIGCSVFSGIQSDGAAATGYIPMPSPDEAPDGGHSMLLVGAQYAKRRFIVRQSWGPGWGDSGYGYMDFEYILNPNLTDELWAISKI